MAEQCGRKLKASGSHPESPSKKMGVVGEVDEVVKEGDAMEEEVAEVSSDDVNDMFKTMMSMMKEVKGDMRCFTSP
jgi:hypothetical protein